MNKPKKMMPFAILAAAFLLTACGGGASSSSHATGFSPTSSDSSSESSGSSESSSSSSEEPSKKALETFGEKIAAGNYKVVCEGFLTTNVPSEDVIYFDYNEALKTSHDYCAVSIGGETFQTALIHEKIDTLLFIDKGQAIDIGAKMTPNYWYARKQIGKDIFDLFQNSDPTKPLLFTSDDPIVQASLGQMAAINSLYVSSIDNITMEFDKEDMTKATIKADYYEMRTPKSLALTIELGTADIDQRITDWRNDPNRAMPADVKDAGVWDGNYLGAINTVLMLVNQQEAMNQIPFIDFASYACWSNMDTCIQEQQAVIRDYHGTIKNVEQYKEKLVQQNYNPAIDEKGEPVFRRLLRAHGNHASYVEIGVEYDQGFKMTIKRQYDIEKFGTRSGLNALIEPQGFPVFPETDAITAWFGEDDVMVQEENWAYFHDYQVYAVANLKYLDEDDALAYLDAYAAELVKAGYVKDPKKAEWEKNTTANNMAFSYATDDAGHLRIILTKENFDDPATMKADVEAAGFPTLDVTAPKMWNCKETKQFEWFYYVNRYTLAYRNIAYFDDNDKCKTYFDAYIASLAAAGFTKSQTGDYAKGNLKVTSLDPADGMCGLYFFVSPTE